MHTCRACGARIAEGLLCLTCERQIETRPAPKEKEMLAEFQTCPQCGNTTQWRGDVEKGTIGVSSIPCLRCRDEEDDRVAALRAVAERAYFAALSTAKGNAEQNASFAAEIALATVRQWDGFMAQVDEAVKEAEQCLNH